ncbi:YHS domain-containing (seleno)protein [Rapidithrix thailandica]|uniref:YHS domain-containing (Seleno)protein n=1 Tax=Rapidithrix thailandica TaxID=413964 RepID=A0AAW9SH70_9BACT
MKTLLKTGILTFFTFGLLVYSLMAQDKAQFNIDDSKIALNGYSAVSYLDLNLAQRGDKDYMSEYEEVKYFFVNAEQKKKFDTNPGKYLPQFGGYCATGVAINAKFRTDPNKFLVRNGKLYLFLNSIEVDALQVWLADEKSLTKKAYENWPKLSQ